VIAFDGVVVGLCHFTWYSVIAVFTRSDSVTCHRNQQGKTEKDDAKYYFPRHARSHLFGYSLFLGAKVSNGHAI
jgi:hypothetical protein